MVKMERLSNLRSLSDEELRHMIKTLTNPKMFNRLKAKVGMFNVDQVLAKQSHGQLIEILVDKVRRENIKDPQLQAAMDLAATTGMEFDITPNNIMVRKTANGPQLVLADPVAN
jgi:hypothetical protein